MLLKIKLGPSAIPLSSPNDAANNIKRINTVKFIINYSIVVVEEKNCTKENLTRTTSVYLNTILSRNYDSKTKCNTIVIIMIILIIVMSRTMFAENQIIVVIKTKSTFNLGSTNK